MKASRSSSTSSAVNPGLYVGFLVAPFAGCLAPLIMILQNIKKSYFFNKKLKIRAQIPQQQRMDKKIKLQIKILNNTIASLHPLNQNNQQLINWD